MNTPLLLDSAIQLYNDLQEFDNKALAAIRYQDEVVSHTVSNKTRQQVILDIVAQEYGDDTLVKVLSSNKIDVSNLNFGR